MHVYDTFGDIPETNTPQWRGWSTGTNMRRLFERGNQYKRESIPLQLATKHVGFVEVLSQRAGCSDWSRRMIRKDKEAFVIIPTLSAAQACSLTKVQLLIRKQKWTGMIKSILNSMRENGKEKGKKMPSQNTSLEICMKWKDLVSEIGNCRWEHHTAFWLYLEKLRI